MNIEIIETFSVNLCLEARHLTEQKDHFLINKLNFMSPSIGSVMRELKSQEDCIKALEIYYWCERDKAGWPRRDIIPKCPNPNCKSQFVTELKINIQPKQYQCNEKDCRKRFSVYTNTPFSRARFPLRKWFEVYYYLRRNWNVKDISKELDLRTTTVKRIKKVLEEQDEAQSTKFLWKIRRNYLKYQKRFNRRMW